MIDPLSLKNAGSAAADSVTKIGSNNRCDSPPHGTGAILAVEPGRGGTVGGRARDLAVTDDETVALLRERSGVERDAAVKKEIATALALGALDGTTPERASRRSTPSRKRQPGRAQSTGAGLEEDQRPESEAAARLPPCNIDGSRNFYSGIETLFFGLSLGSVLVLIAIGLAITFGVMGVINMAHGELMMLGAYTTYVVQTAMPGHIGISISGRDSGGISGLGSDRRPHGAHRHLDFSMGRPLETLLATFGVSLILQQTVRSIFSALNRSVITPEWMSGSLRLNDALAITYNRLYIVIFTLIVFSLIVLVLKRTRIGLRYSRRLAESRHGQGDGHPHRMGGCHDVRTRAPASPEWRESRLAN